jgi:hypothetical protein
LERKFDFKTPGRNLLEQKFDFKFRVEISRSKNSVSKLREKIYGPGDRFFIADSGMRIHIVDSVDSKEELFKNRADGTRNQLVL